MGEETEQGLARSCGRQTGSGDICSGGRNVCVGNNGAVHYPFGNVALALVIQEEKGLVLPNRAADGPAELLVADVGGLAGVGIEIATGMLGEVVDGIGEVGVAYPLRGA